MRIKHHVFLHVSPEIRERLAALAVHVDEGLTAFDVFEDDTAWPEIRSLITEWSAVDAPSAEFSSVELEAAAWLQLRTSWNHGYPQPDDGENGYLSVTLDGESRCETCGVGGRQVAPYRMRKEPRWGRRAAMQLHWVRDEYFVTPEMWAALLRPLGVESRPVFNADGTRELSTVVQLAVSESAAVDVDGAPSETCAVCHAVRFDKIAARPFPALRESPAGHLVHTREYFGSGASGHHEVIVSADVYAALTKAKVRGFDFVPLAPA